MWEGLTNFDSLGKTHNYLLEQTQHNNSRISRSTECLSDNINDLKIINFHWEEPFEFTKKLFWKFRNSKKHIFRETSLRRFIKGWFWDQFNFLFI